MVKITNQSGDIKTGKQGTCCYQRVYGTQVRRLISPKRIAGSKAQSTQRQLFIDGLAFRKSLSRTAKTYLDGYCCHHGLIDTLGIPLTWDKLAMRIALATPRVTIVS
jgi:hypothetical protein